MPRVDRYTRTSDPCFSFTLFFAIYFLWLFTKYGLGFFLSNDTWNYLIYCESQFTWYYRFEIFNRPTSIIIISCCSFYCWTGGEQRNDADNVGDSEDSDDEWNYYRPSENESEDRGGGAGGKDPALVEKPDCAQEEKETCSPKPQEEEDSSPLSQPPSQASLEHDDDEITAEIVDHEDREQKQTEQQVPSFESPDFLEISREKRQLSESEDDSDSQPEREELQPLQQSSHQLLDEKDVSSFDFFWFFFYLFVFRSCASFFELCVENVKFEVCQLFERKPRSNRLLVVLQGDMTVVKIVLRPDYISAPPKAYCISFFLFVRYHFFF